MRVCAASTKAVLITDMLEVPKDLSTTLTWKLVRGTGVMSLPNGNNDKYDTMDNQQT